MGLPIKNQEMWDVADHHQKVIKRRLPVYRCSLFESLGKSKVFLRVDRPYPPSSYPPSSYPPSWVYELSDTVGWKSILLATFTPDFLKITSRNPDKIVYYGNPEFTGDFLYNELKDLVRVWGLSSL